MAFFRQRQTIDIDPVFGKRLRQLPLSKPRGTEQRPNRGVTPRFSIAFVSR
jgi:hypothetical protein